MDVLYTMLAILGSMAAALVVLFKALGKPDAAGTWLPPRENAAKRACELWFLGYGVVWILAFGAIVVFQLYEAFDARAYLVVCGGLASPLLLQPFLAPWVTGDERRPLSERYSLKANVWLLIFSFVGNYWYTHYFYSVLRAKYTMPSVRLNNVPIPMYFATHFYFCFYHCLSNAALRKVRTMFKPSARRAVFVCAAVVAMAYLTAFMETLTIASFPYYSFEDRDAAYTVGSAFYGIYFLVSFPMFARIDETPPGAVDAQTHTLEQALLEVGASSMLVLCLLDFVRLGLRIPFTMAIPETFLHG
ncbi:hypothetical protein M885DRAFT_620936 [Pelagophyceae sp. CCMP2097]|nr:hypothetical protein M885DRAFT_620936 [Pelagophyceae sp. CCMP2097]